MVLDKISLIKAIFVFIIGSCFGSFVNVVIYRLPRGESVISPGSHCIQCNYKIRWFENIPIISWFLLKGRCTHCNTNISVIYPTLELFCALLFLLNNYSSPSSFETSSELMRIIFGWILISILLTVAVLDIKYFWIPDSSCRFGLISGIGSSAVLTLLSQDNTGLTLLLDSIIATFFGYIAFRLISTIGLQLFKRPAMGKGDAKLSAMLGSWLGIQGLCLTIWLAFNLAGIYVLLGLITKKINRYQKVPFGAFLASAGILVWHFGNTMLSPW